MIPILCCEYQASCPWKSYNGVRCKGRTWEDFQLVNNATPTITWEKQWFTNYKRQVSATIGDCFNRWSLTIKYILMLNFAQCNPHHFLIQLIAWHILPPIQQCVYIARGLRLKIPNSEWILYMNNIIDLKRISNLIFEWSDSYNE